MDIPNGFYVYTLIDPRTDTIFYVGKGKGKRINKHATEARSGHNCYKCNKIRKIWSLGMDYGKQIVLVTQNEQEALDREAALISEIGLGVLCNRTSGGGTAYTQPPDVPRDEMTERDFIAERRRFRCVEPDDLRKTVLEWRSQQINFLRSEYRDARIFNRDPDRAARLAGMIEELRQRIVKNIEPDIFS